MMITTWQSALHLALGGLVFGFTFSAGAWLLHKILK